MSRIRSLTALSAAFLGLTVTWLGGCQQPPPPPDYGKLYQDASVALRKAAIDPDARVRTKALEALAQTQGSTAGPIMLDALNDNNMPVMFAAAMSIGEIRYAPAREMLVALAKDKDAPPKLLAAAAYALHRIGDDTYTGQIGRLLFFPDKWVRCTAAMVLGKMGEPSATDPLRSLKWEDHDPVVQLQVNEALAELGDERAMSLLEAFTKSQFLEDRLIAVQVLGRLGNQRYIEPLKRLMDDTKQDPMVRVAAAGSLAQLHDYSGYRLCLGAIKDPRQILQHFHGSSATVAPSDMSNLQSLALLALGKMDKIEAVVDIEPLLHSPDGAVRVSAAQATLELLKTYEPMASQEGKELAPASAPAAVQAATCPSPEMPTKLPAEVSPAPAEVPPAVTATPAAPATPATLAAPATPAIPATPATPVTPAAPATPAASAASAPEALPTPAAEPAPAVEPSSMAPPAASAPAPAPVPAAPASSAYPFAPPAAVPAVAPAAPAPAVTGPETAASQPVPSDVEKLLENQPRPRLKTSGAKE